MNVYRHAEIWPDPNLVKIHKRYKDSRRFVLRALYLAAAFNAVGCGVSAYSQAWLGVICHLLVLGMFKWHFSRVLRTMRLELVEQVARYEADKQLEQARIR